MNQKDVLKKFLELFSEKEFLSLENLFDLFFTFEEKENLASRYLIIEALLKGQLTQREIAKKYHVSIAQITRGSNALKTVDPIFKKFLEKNFKKDKKR